MFHIFRSDYVEYRLFSDFQRIFLLRSNEQINKWTIERQRSFHRFKKNQTDVSNLFIETGIKFGYTILFKGFWSAIMTYVYIFIQMLVSKSNVHFTIKQFHNKWRTVCGANWGITVSDWNNNSDRWAITLTDSWVVVLLRHNSICMTDAWVFPLQLKWLLWFSEMTLDIKLFMSRKYSQLDNCMHTHTHTHVRASARKLGMNKMHEKAPDDHRNHLLSKKKKKITRERNQANKKMIANVWTFAKNPSSFCA